MSISRKRIRRTRRIPQSLSAGMTYPELEQWFEDQFEKLRRKTARDQRHAASAKQRQMTMRGYQA